MPIHMIDIVLLLLGAFFFIRGFQKGLIVELTLILALILGIIASMKLANIAIINLKPVFGNSAFLPYLGYLLVFLVVFFGVQILGRSIEKVLKVTQLNFLNRILGGVSGLFKFLFFVSLVYWLTNQVDWLTQDFKENVYSYQYTVPLAPFIIEKSIEFFPVVTNIIEEVEIFFREINDNLT